MQHAFNTAQIITGDHIGAWFADGTSMLQRQGCSNTIRGQLNPRGIWVEIVVSNHRRHTKLYYEDKAHPFTTTGNIAHQAKSTYCLSLGEKHDALLPKQLITETLNWAEVHTHARPVGIRQQIEAYMYGFNDRTSSCDKNDILLMPFRYDSGVHSVIDVDGKIIAHLSNFEEKTFSPTYVEIHSTTPAIKNSLEKAQRLGFHQCDTRNGSDYCMRRLTWLAAQYYLKEFTLAGEILPVFVLANDTETPAALVPHEASSAELAHS